MVSPAMLALAAKRVRDTRQRETNARERAADARAGAIAAEKDLHTATAERERAEADFREMGGTNDVLA